MTAADVVYSLNLHRTKDSKSAAKAYLTSITDITATGPLEVTILLSGGDADIPYILTDYHLCVMPEGANPTAAIGTGPYVSEKFEPGVRMSMRRNASYWMSDAAYVDTVEILGISDPVARAECAARRLDPSHEPGESEGGRDRREESAAALQRLGGRALLLPHALRYRALQGQQCPPRAQICHQSRKRREGGAEGLWQNRQRSADSRLRSVLRRRYSPTALRPRQGPFPHEAGRI